MSLKKITHYSPASTQAYPRRILDEPKQQDRVCLAPIVEEIQQKGIESHETFWELYEAKEFCRSSNGTVSRRNSTRLPSSNHLSNQNRITSPSPTSQKRSNLKTLYLSIKLCYEFEAERNSFSKSNSRISPCFVNNT